MRKMKNSDFMCRHRKRSLCHAVFCLSVFIMSCANNKTAVTEKVNEKDLMMPDSLVALQMNDSLACVLFHPDTVKCHHLSCKEKVKGNDVEVVDNYVRDGFVSTLSANQTSILQYILLSDTANYSNDTVLVQSPYLPVLEFEFVKDKYKPVSVIVSTLNRSWQIAWCGKQIHNYNIQPMKQVERFCNYFINNFERKEEKK